MIITRLYRSRTHTRRACRTGTVLDGVTNIEHGLCVSTAQSARCLSRIRKREARRIRRLSI